MEYSFAIIESKFKIKTKRILTVCTLIIYLVLGGLIPQMYINYDIEINRTIILFYSIPVILTFIFIRLFIDKFKITGLIKFDLNKSALIYNKEHTNFDNIKMIYIGSSSMSGGKYKKTSNTYFIQIVEKEGITINLNITRNQWRNDKLLKSSFNKKVKDLFSVLDELKIRYELKKNKHFAIEK